MADRACVPALIIVIAVAPVQRWLRTKGWPGWASTLVVVLAVYAIMLSLALAIIVSIARLGTELPKYAGQGSTLVNSVMAQLAKLGIGPDQIKQAASSLDIGKLAGAIGSLLGSGRAGDQLRVPHPAAAVPQRRRQWHAVTHGRDRRGAADGRGGAGAPRTFGGHDRCHPKRVFLGVDSAVTVETQ